MDATPKKHRLTLAGIPSWTEKQSPHTMPVSLRRAARLHHLDQAASGCERYADSVRAIAIAGEVGPIASVIAETATELAKQIRQLAEKEVI
tara:strand:+ start:7671 stop:7943 length:273 start_codon:yes stop_codon:yes gene_type:complete